MGVNVPSQGYLGLTVHLAIHEASISASGENGGAAETHPALVPTGSAVERDAEDGRSGAVSDGGAGFSAITPGRSSP